MSNTNTTTSSGYSIAIGVEAGSSNQGLKAIAIGYQAGLSGQPSNSIILNADSTALSPTTTTNPNPGCFINPIRQENTLYQSLYYDSLTKEIVYYTPP